MSTNIWQNISCITTSGLNLLAEKFGDAPVSNFLAQAAPAVNQKCAVRLQEISTEMLLVQQAVSQFWFQQA